ncbi:iron-containing redox enzyme family protein [Catenovulum sp. SM1970]|uniref:iron-containing redox enzyme family protein n=1 Tax=Marinifaba aquimaris TaxID=2741323 RepID=UPI0015744DFB|nr:iron-containing redox enzyme family protein [Marinifaba aquimaris]NTS75306.1 iron-containing redox enzyme family protein [Marinifaba aquimaris]
MITDNSSDIVLESINDKVEFEITLEDYQTLPEVLMQLLEHAKPYQYLQSAPNELKHVRQLLKTVTERFCGPNDDGIAFQLHKSLNTIYDYQINSFANSSQYDPILMEIMLELESAWISFEKSRTPKEEMPTDAREFTKWLKSYALKHPSSQHDIFKYLADECTQEEMTYFFSQEVTIDPRFDDLIALMQVGIDKPEVKMELASNFWDEMGNGKPDEVHTKLFSNLYDEIDVFKDGEGFLDVLDRASWQALACGNTLLYSVLHRKHLNIGLGALGTVEIISPYRFSHLTRGFKRLGVSDKASVYHQTHIAIDAIHGNGWLNNAIKPIVAETPQAREEIFFGSMLRMNTSADYCEHIEKHFSNNQD